MSIIDTQDITSTATETAATIEQLDGAAKELGATIRTLLAECAPAFRRKAISPQLDSDNCGNGSRACWAGVRFAGKRRQSHKGQGGTWQWRIEGQSAYITLDGDVHLIEWDGEATDVGGCEGYMDTFTSQVTSDKLEDHLAETPESAQQIVDAIRKVVTEDALAAKDRLTRIAKIIAELK